MPLIRSNEEICPLGMPGKLLTDCDVRHVNPDGDTALCGLDVLRQKSDAALQP